MFNGYSVPLQCIFIVMPIRIDGIQDARSMTTSDGHSNIFAIIMVKFGKGPVIRKFIEASIRIFCDVDTFTSFRSMLILMDPLHKFIADTRLPTHR